MGGSYNSERIESGVKRDELQAKYRDIVAHCQWESGHGGYSGTFAEKPELRIMPGTWGLEDARRNCQDENDKWGPSFAYQLDIGGWYIGGWCSS